MGFKDQLNKLKDNWLMIILVLVVLFVITSFGGTGSGGGLFKSAMYAESAIYSADTASYRGGYMPPVYDNSFAPDVSERKIVKTTSMNVELERGTFQAKEQRLKDVVSSSDSFLLNANSNKNGEGIKQYYSGYYTIKVETSKYDAVIAQLKDLGEVKSFNENENDITGSYTNTAVELEAEKARLERYQKMYDEAKEVSDKITLNDRIFDQERRVKYLADSIKNMDTRVEYSTISLAMSEKQSSYVDVTFSSFAKLVKNLVGSINALLYLVFIVVPWAVVVLIIWFIAKLVRKKK